jgi:hypothetical protein
MNKALKKSIEAELESLISSILVLKNKEAASQIHKSIREAAKGVAKKFVKRIPAPAAAKKTTRKSAKVPAKKKAAGVRTKRVVKKKTRLKK